MEGSISSRHERPRKVALAAYLVAAVVSGAFLALYLLGAFEPASYYFYDIMFTKIRGPVKADDRVVIVDLDEETTDHLGLRLGGWTRSHFATVLRNLSSAGASVIAFDHVFDRPTEVEADDAFAEEIGAAAESGAAVVLACNLSSSGELRRPMESFAEKAYSLGHIHMRAGRGLGIIRSMTYFTVAGDEIIDSLALNAVSAFECIEEKDIDRSGGRGRTIRFGEHLLPKPEMMINFPGAARSFRYISAWRVCEDKFDHGLVKGRIVLLGTSHQYGQDFKHVPTDWKMPGVEVHAAAVATILNDSALRWVPGWQMAMGIVILALAAGVVSAHPRTGLLAASAAAVVPAVGLFWASVVLFRTSNLYLDWFPAAAATSTSAVAGGFYSWMLARRRATHIRSVFGRYVSKNVVDALLAGEAAVDLSGRRKRMSVLFCDIRGFTSIAENMEPAEVGRLLNRYFSEMIGVVFASGGTMDKLMGDCVMAFFGDPLPAEDHAERACRCADAILRKVSEINEGRPGEKAITVGVGVNTGEMTVGNLGAPEFVDYTVIGDNVNLASRFEGLNKLYGTQTVVGDATRGDAAGAFEFRELDLVAVKGRAEPIGIFEILGPKGRVSPERLRLRASFEEALGLYRSAEFDRASELFRALAGEFADEPSRVYLVRCQEYIHNPPGPSWRGEYVATSK